MLSALPSAVNPGSPGPGSKAGTPNTRPCGVNPQECAGLGLTAERSSRNPLPVRSGAASVQTFRRPRHRRSPHQACRWSPASCRSTPGCRPAAVQLLPAACESCFRFLSSSSLFTWSSVHIQVLQRRLHVGLTAASRLASVAVRCCPVFLVEQRIGIDQSAGSANLTQGSHARFAKFVDQRWNHRNPRRRKSSFGSRGSRSLPVSSNRICANPVTPLIVQFGDRTLASTEHLD
jgi:hypothetical protein